MPTNTLRHVTYAQPSKCILSCRNTNDDEHSALGICTMYMYIVHLLCIYTDSTDVRWQFFLVRQRNKLSNAVPIAGNEVTFSTLPCGVPRPRNRPQKPFSLKIIIFYADNCHSPLLAKVEKTRSNVHHSTSTVSFYLCTETKSLVMNTLYTWAEASGGPLA